MEGMLNLHAAERDGAAVTVRIQTNDNSVTLDKFEMRGDRVTVRLQTNGGETAQQFAQGTGHDVIVNNKEKICEGRSTRL